MALQSNNNSQPRQAFFTGIENRNFLSPIGFKFTIDKLKGVEFFCQSASIPAVTMNSADQGTRFNKVRHPGDELYYEDLFIRFLVDENMKNWYQVHDWMREITTPYSSKEFKYSRGGLKSINELEGGATKRMGNYDNQWLSDCSLFILSSNYNPVAEFVFKGAFPISLTTLNFDASVQEVNYFTAEASFRYNYFNYKVWDAAAATDITMPATYRGSYLNQALDGLQN